MKLTLLRFSHSEDSTGGLLFVNGDFFCFTCEDEGRAVKLSGETRIPSGTYKIKLRNEGGMTQRYAAKFPFHRGMIWLQDVPGFEWVYIHVGNTDDDTEGCILVGFGADTDEVESTVSRSVEAYSELYQYILLALDHEEEITIEVTEI